MSQTDLIGALEVVHRTTFSRSVPSVRRRREGLKMKKICTKSVQLRRCPNIPSLFSIRAVK